MKKILLNLTLGLLLILASPAWSAIILDDSFAYDDGPIALAAGSAWTSLSGTLGQAEVVGGRLQLSQTESEDVSASLVGAPYEGPTLYASFSVRFTALPGGAGNSFAHFRDGTATGFRCRVYATVAGASSGKFRLGVACAAGSPEIVPLDLDLAVDYLVVIRHQTGSPASTLWIDPVSESSAVNRADASDSASASPIRFFGFRQAGPNPGIGGLSVDDLRVGESFAEAVPGLDPHLDPPTVSALPDQSIAANASTPAIPFTIADGETAPADLMVTATSDDSTLLPPTGVVFGGTGADRTVVVTPAAGRQGSAKITVTVLDSDDNAARRTFRVTVGAPTLFPIAHQRSAMDTETATVQFGVADPEGDTLQLAAASTNSALVAPESMTFSGQGSSRQIVIHPTPGKSGLSWITIFLSDGHNTVSNGFLFTVFPVRGVVFGDAFDYLDGSLVTNSMFTWVTHSASTGQTGQTQVIQGTLVLRSAQTEDFHATLTNAPYRQADAWLLYARFTVNFTARPGNSPDYFAHFRGASSGTAARIFATSNGAEPGKLRLGIANDAATPSAFWPSDLETNVSYVVVTRYSVGTGESTLWVNPASEDDNGVSGTDDPPAFDVWAYAFRQSSGIGTLSVDDLKIGTAFTDVMPLGYRIEIKGLGSALEIRWPDAAVGYRLQSSDTFVAGHWTEVTAQPELVGGHYIVQLPRDANRRFFRLTRE